VTNSSDAAQAYGCNINAITSAELFRRYDRSRFIYEAKRSQLETVMPLIRENWKRALSAGTALLWEISWDDPSADKWASVVSWRTTLHGWHGQHLFSTAGPAASRAVLLAAQAVAIEDTGCHSQQNWFRPDNRFAAAAFGRILDHLTPDQAAVEPLEYLLVPRNTFSTALTGIVPLDGGSCPELVDLARVARSEVYAEAEGLRADDLLLAETDSLYRSLGLRRYRNIWLAVDQRGNPIGAVIAHRGPLGMSFSFIENRYDLLLSPSLPIEQIGRVVVGLLAAAESTYRDLEIPWIPVIARTAAAEWISGAAPVIRRSYTQSHWLRDGFLSWQQHIAGLYRVRSQSPIPIP
jgi:hypothetical protein